MSEGDSGRPVFDFRSFVTRIAAARGVTFDEVMSRSQTPEIREVRVDVYEALRERGWSFPHIGLRMKRDHSTIIKSLQHRAKKRADRGDL